MLQFIIPINKPVDLVFPVASISTFYKIGDFSLHSALWRRQFVGPEEVVCSFEIFCKILDLLNQILHANDPIFAKRKSNQWVICQGNSFLIDFAITMLADQFIYRLKIWVPPPPAHTHHMIDRAKSKGIPKKNKIYFCFIEYTKALAVWSTTNCEIFLKRWEYLTTLPASWETCMQVKKQQLDLDIEQWTGSKLSKEYVKAVYCQPYLTYT